MKRFKHFYEDTVDTKIVNGQTIWLRIDGGNPLWWEIVILKGDKVVSSEKFDSEQKALVRYHEIV